MSKTKRTPDAVAPPAVVGTGPAFEVVAPEPDYSAEAHARARAKLTPAEVQRAADGAPAKKRGRPPKQKGSDAPTPVVPATGDLKRVTIGDLRNQIQELDRSVTLLAASVLLLTAVVVYKA